MAAFNFPNSPSTNDLHTENSVTWKWDGTVWKRQGVAGAQGAAGAQGHQGVQGAAGAAGAQGAAGSATISNNADNRVITGGSGTNLNGEATLTYDGTFLTATSNNFVFKGIDTNASNAESFIQLNAGKIFYHSDENNAVSGSGHYFNVDGSEKLRIASDGDLHIGGTARPDPTTSGFTVENNGKDVRWSNGGGTSGTTSSSLAIYGGGSSTNVMASTSWGGSIGLYNTNNTDGNSNCLAFGNSNQLATSFVIGETTSHSSRNGELVFATSSGAAPAERVRISSSGTATFTGQIFQTSAGSGTSKITLNNASDTTGMDVGYSESSGVGFINVGQSGSGLSIKTGGTANSNERLIITSGGDVSIGQVDSTSGATLHVRSNASAHTKIELSTKDNYNGSHQDAYISFTQQNGTEIALIHCDTETGAANRADLAFYTNYGSLSERVRIKDTGNVSIGTANKYVGGAPSSGLGKVNVYHSGAGANDWAMQVRQDSSANGNGVFIRAGNGASKMALDVRAYNEANILLQVNGAGQVTKPLNPSFYGRGYNGVSSDNWLFDAVASSNGEHNQGSHFNNSTGIFTCPIAGHYFIGGGVGYCDAQNYIMAGFRYNGNTQLNLWEDGTASKGNKHVSASYALVIQCNVNDTLSFVHASSYSAPSTNTQYAWGSIYLVG